MQRRALYARAVIAPTEQEVLESMARLGFEATDLATADDRCADNHRR